MWSRNSIQPRRSSLSVPPDSVTAPCHDEFMVVSTLVGRLEAMDISALGAGDVAAALRDPRPPQGVRHRNRARARSPGERPRCVRIRCSRGRVDRPTRHVFEAPGGTDLPTSRSDGITARHVGPARNGPNRRRARRHAGRCRPSARRQRTDRAAVTRRGTRHSSSSLDACSVPAVRRTRRRPTRCRSGARTSSPTTRATSLTKGINSETGMYWLRADFDPESGARLFRAIDAQTAALSKATDAASTSASSSDRSRPRAPALVGLATSSNRTTRPGRVELLALVDLNTLVSGLRDHSVCEFDDGTDIPVATMRRLACDAHILPVGWAATASPWMSAEPTPRHRGSAPSIARMYRTCGIGTCDVPFDRCEILASTSRAPTRATPTSTGSFRAAAVTTTSSTRVAGSSNSIATR